MSEDLEIPVHPVAELFPMLDEEEMQALADDIRAHGLRHPIVLDGDGRIVDGRNRLAGCLRAGVEPLFLQLNGESAEEYIESANLHRRHLTKSQRAMLAAILRDRNLVTNKTVQELGEQVGTSGPLISYAGYVLKNAPNLASSVVSGALTIKEAYEEVKAEERVITSRDEMNRKLRLSRPDLAQLVDEGRLSLPEAKLLSEREEEQHRQLVATVTAQVDAALRALDCHNQPGEQRAAYLWSTLDRKLLGPAVDFSIAQFDRVLATVSALRALALEESHGKERQKTRPHARLAAPRERRS